MHLSELDGRATITVPEAGEILGVGRDAAYAAANKGEIPTLRIGRRLLVPVPHLLAMLGATATPETEIGERSPAGEDIICAAIWRQVDSGRSVGEVADDFGISIEDVCNALVYGAKQEKGDSK